MSDLRNRDLAAAIARIDFRAERRDLFLELYEDTGVLNSLAANTHQIVQGRRGSGKTHLLGSFEDRTIREFTDFVAVKVDLRDCVNVPPSFDAKQKSFWAFWLIMHYVVSGLRSNLELLRSLYPKRFDVDHTRAVVALLGMVHTRIRKAELDPNFVGRFLSAAPRIEGFSPPQAVESHLDTIGSVFDDVCRHLRLKYIVILLDEWSSMQPLDFQPLLAELLKKSLFKSKVLAFKIATIRYRSRFESIGHEGRVGLELGADVFADVDLDLEVVWERDPSRAIAFFSSLLRKHIRYVVTQSGLSEDSIMTENGNWTNSWFASADCFRELVRAGEGIPRDFLNIFKRSYSAFLQDDPKKGERISIRHIRSSAASWFEEDKRPAAQVDVDSYQLFQDLLEEFVAKKRTKHFMVSQSVAVDENIQRLVDSRLLHRIKRGWSTKHHPGIRYDVFSIDYGAFVNTMDTSVGKTIRLSFAEEDVEDSDTPLDTVDLRNIRHQLFSPRTKNGAK